MVTETTNMGNTVYPPAIKHGLENPLVILLHWDNMDKWEMVRCMFDKQRKNNTQNVYEYIYIYIRRPRP